MASERQVISSVGTSLDGYIASRDGSYGWLDRAAMKAKGKDFGMGALTERKAALREFRKSLASI